jgi:hypothetical protein
MGEDLKTQRTVKEMYKRIAGIYADEFKHCFQKFYDTALKKYVTSQRDYFEEY